MDMEMGWGKFRYEFNEDEKMYRIKFVYNDESYYIARKHLENAVIEAKRIERDGYKEVEEMRK